MKKTTSLDRRQFLGVAVALPGAAVLAAQSTPSIPRRVLGKTGAEISILGFGGGSRFLAYQDEEEALAILNRAIDSGINYLDTAMSYGEGKSEERYGKVLKYRRKEVWVTTKVSTRDYDEAMRAMEASLRRLQTDHVDLLHIHSLGDADDLTAVERPNGVLRAAYRIRDEKMARFIGMTSHTDARTLRTAIERHDLDCVMMALNAATNTGFATGFERIALPAAQAKNLGILAMKIAGQERLLGEEPGKATMRELLSYTLSLPVASCIVGMPRPEHLEENLAIARSFRPLSEAEREQIRTKVASSVVAFDEFLRHHRDDIPLEPTVGLPV
ncbi:MAG: hypothetical protein Kow00109_03960 [Acidobacteriota bacterium]